MATASWRETTDWSACLTQKGHLFGYNRKLFHTDLSPVASGIRSQERELKDLARIAARVAETQKLSSDLAKMDLGEGFQKSLKADHPGRAFATNTRVRSARPMTAARRRLRMPGRLGGGLDLGGDIAGEVLRLPRARRGTACRLQGHSFLRLAMIRLSSVTVPAMSICWEGFPHPLSRTAIAAATRVAGGVIAFLPQSRPRRRTWRGLGRRRQRALKRLSVGRLGCRIFPV